MNLDRAGSLLAWFGEERRHLPWRETTDPYPVLVSEVMLQQTQVDRVIPKYASFMHLWPDIGTLASADTKELLRAWSGLGYNSRAVRLRDAARIIHRDGWPDSITGLRELPGIGPYTAAAVGSISFGYEAPAVDTNLKRVLSRWAGEPLNGASLLAYANDAVSSPAGDWNQALMDLGAMLCTPKQPECSKCPVSEWCIDPTVYEPPRGQPRFEGSHRQLRGALLRAHLTGDDPLETGLSMGRSDEEIARTITNLRDEGLMEPTGRTT